MIPIETIPLYSLTESMFAQTFCTQKYIVQIFMTFYYVGQKDL